MYRFLIDPVSYCPSTTSLQQQYSTTIITVYLGYFIQCTTFTVEIYMPFVPQHVTAKIYYVHTLQQL